MIDPQADWDVTQIHNLIPWKHLTLAGIQCKNFTINQARKNLSIKETIIPNWNPEILGNIKDSLEEKHAWEKAWVALNWKSRPHDHFEAYWRLLHKRSQRFTPSEEELDQQEERDWHPTSCVICNCRDTIDHGFVSCPQIKHIWETSLQLLELLTGYTDIARIITIDLRSVVYGFQDLREAVRKPLKPRILLWHSCIIHIINRRRTQAILEHSRQNPRPTQIQIDFEGWENELINSINQTVLKIYYDYRRKNRLPKFELFWTRDCSLWTLNTNPESGIKDLDFILGIWP
jgi:hypothetical protein